jgi:cytochrome c553
MSIRKPVIATVTGLLMLLLVVGNVQAKGNAERGADLTYDCIECHGMDGKGDFETPPIAGLKESYILQQLRAFYTGKRKSVDGIMHLYTEDRTDQELQDLAAYWASVKK